MPATRPVPEPGPGELLIEVAAAGINRPDVLQRQGLYPAAERRLRSSRHGGCGNGRRASAAASTRFKIGDRVCALVSGGGYAEYCVAPEATTLPVPQGLGMVEAAALPEAVFTVWHNVFERAALKPGEWLLVHGGSERHRHHRDPDRRGARRQGDGDGGKRREGPRLPRRSARVRAINYREEDFVEAVRETTGGHGADVILDMVGGDYIERDLKAAALEGRIVQIAFLKGAKVEIDLMRLMLRRLTLTGSTLRIQSTEAKARMAKAIEERIWPLVAAGKLKPVIDSTFPLKDAAEAHRRIDAPDHIGKIVLVQL